MTTNRPIPPKQRLLILPIPVWLAWGVLHTGWRLICWAWNEFRSLSQSAAIAVGNGATSFHTDADCAKFARLLYGYLNHYRQKHGYTELQWNAQLEQSALYQSTRMVETGEFAHTLSDGVQLTDRVQRFGYQYQICAENIAYYFANYMSIAELAEDTHEGWLNSPPHLENIENRDVTEIGIGVVKSSEGVFYSTQNFGKPTKAALPFARPFQPAPRA